MLWWRRDEAGKLRSTAVDRQRGRDAGERLVRGRRHGTPQLSARIHTRRRHTRPLTVTPAARQ